MKNLYSSNEIACWLALAKAPKLKNQQIADIISHVGGITALFQCDLQQLQALGFSKESSQYLIHFNWDKLQYELDWLKQPGRYCIPIVDRHYPFLLKQLHKPPIVLFAQGQIDLLSSKQIAIVGSRHPSYQGQEMAHLFANELAQYGLTITSGLALGIDTAAHRGALQASCPTIAVLGSGLDHIYPTKHVELAQNIINKGLLLSEYTPATPVRALHFPQRNRIISGLSVGVLVVEAALRSGSLITAHCANEQGREVFAIPNSIHHPLAKGCHALIRQGAKLVETVDDILEELPFLDQEISKQPRTSYAKSMVKKLKELDATHQRILKCVDFSATSIDQIVQRSHESVEKVCSMLLNLELAGYIIATQGGYTQK